MCSSCPQKRVIDAIRTERQRSFEAGPLERALKVIAGEIYSKGEHFTLELLQNADDNTYEETVCPTLQFRLSDDSLIVTCNEVGMTEEDVRSMCDVGNSAKKERSCCIGEKGIGFKSVFMCSSQPHICSNGFSFKLCAPTYIVPEWIPRFPIEADPVVTTIYLPFDDPKKWDAELFDILAPSTLLFLRNLRKLVWCATSKPEHRVELFKRVKGNSMTITRTFYHASVPSTSTNKIAQKREAETHNFLVVRKEFDPPRSAFDQRREKFTKTEVVCAFGLDQDGAALPEASSQFFSYLPVRKCGLRFILQANFILTASREDLDQKSPWNRWLRTAAIETFLRAIDEHFKKAPELQRSFYGFLPSEHDVLDDFFREFSEELMISLRGHRCVRSCSNTWEQPCGILIPLPKARKVLDAGLVSEALDLQLIDKSIKLEEHSHILRALGCQRMERSHILTYLKHPSCPELHSRQTNWYLLLYDFLAIVFKEFSHELHDVPIIPVSLRHVVSMASGPAVFFRMPGASTRFAIVEEKLDVQVLLRCATPDERTPAQAFLKKLGLVPLTPQAIVEHHILPTYDQDITLMETDSLFAHVEYIQECLNAGATPLDSTQHGIVEACRSRIRLRGSDLGYHAPDALYVQTSSLYSLLGESVLYSHDQYYSIAQEVLLLLGVSKRLRFEVRRSEFGRHEWKKSCNEYGFIDLPNTHRKYILEEPCLPESLSLRVSQNPEVCTALLKHLDDEWDSYARDIKPRIRSFFRGTSGQCCPYHGLANCDDESCSSVTQAPLPGRCLVIEEVKTCKIQASDGEMVNVQDCYLHSESLVSFFGQDMPYLPVELKCPQFIAALGLFEEASNEMLLQHLQSLSQLYPRQMDREVIKRVRQVYRKLDFEFTDGEDILQTFKKNALILWYDPPSYGAMPERISVKWLKPSDVRWDAQEPEHMEHYDSHGYDINFLQKAYGQELKLFFCEKLHVLPNPNIDDRVRMLQGMQEWYSQRMPWVDSAQRCVEFLYKELSRDCRLRQAVSWVKAKKQDFLDREKIDVDDLKSLPIFRTCTGNWASASSGLFIPDADILLKHFQQCNTAASMIINFTPKDAHLLKHLADTLEIGFLTEKIKQTVTENTISNSRPSRRWSQRLQQVLESAARCVYHAWAEQYDEEQYGSRVEFTSDLETRWQGLAGAVACKVTGTLMVTSRLPNCSTGACHQKSDVFVDADTRTIYISEELHNKIDYEICIAMASLIVELLESKNLTITRREMVEMQVINLLMSAGNVSVSFERTSAMKHIAMLPPKLALALTSDAHPEIRAASVPTPKASLEFSPQGENSCDHGATSSSNQWPVAQQQIEHSIVMSSPSGQPLSAAKGVRACDWLNMSSASAGSIQAQKQASRWPDHSRSFSGGSHYAKVGSAIAGVFWLVPRRDEPAVLCISQTFLGQSGYRSTAHQLMESMLGHRDICFGGRAENDRLDLALRDSLSFIESESHWMSCTGVREGCTFQGVGIGSNKTGIERSAKLALALTIACQHSTQIVSGFPLAFYDLVSSLKDLLHRSRSASNHQIQVASTEPFPNKRPATSSCQFGTKRLCQNAWTEIKTEPLDVQLVEDELSSIITIDDSHCENDEQHTPSLARSVSAFRSCVAQGFVQIARCFSTHPPLQIDCQGQLTTKVASILQEDPGLRAELGRIGSRYVQEASQMYHAARSIFKENDGPQALIGRRPDLVNLDERTVLVSELRYTHRLISPVFRHGGHAGEPIDSLIEKLKTGEVRPSEIPSVLVAPFNGKLYAVTGNRRLHALKCYAEHIGEEVRLKVRVIDHLCPVTAKFLMSYSTANEGETVQVRS